MTGPEGAEGRYLFVDAGEWALFRRPEMAVSWSWRGGEPVGIDRELATDGPGHTGDWVVFLGQSETVTRTAHGQTFSLVVPARASMVERPESVLDSLSTASDQLRVGDRDENVTVFAAPTAVDWGVRGLQFGDSDMWVRDVERLDEPDNTWIHEYVHSRQAFETRSSGRWLTEGSATYYAALLTLEQDRVGFAEFSAFLGRGTLTPQSTAVLADPERWPNAANYWKGSLVAGAVDRQIRLATDGTHSFATAFSRLNALRDPVDGTAMLGVIAGVGGRGVGEYAGTYTRTRQTPQRWSEADHGAAFGGTPARFTYRFAAVEAASDTDETHADGTSANGTSADGASAGGTSADGTGRVAVSGPFRNGTLAGSTFAVYPGETLRVTGEVHNAGGATDEYEQFFAVNGRVRSTVSGTLRPGQSETHSFEHAVGSTDDLTLSFGTDAISVAVYEPATATIERVAANRTRLDGPGTVTLAVTVANGFDAPATRTLAVTRNSETVATRDVALKPGANRTVAVPVHLSEPGEHTLGVGDSGTVTVTVEGGDGDGSTGDGNGGAGDSERGGTGAESSSDGTDADTGPLGPIPALVGGVGVVGVLGGLVILGLIGVLALLVRRSG